MSWKLEGSYFETCSCDVVCPCTASFALGATHDRCRVTLVFRIQNGEVEGVDVSGLAVAAVADTPKVMSEGNWRLGVIMDAAASEEQAEKLGAVFSGALGGPMEALGPLVGENLGVQSAPIEIREDGLRHSVRIGDAIDFEIEDVVPFGADTNEPVRLTGVFHPAGLGADGRARHAFEDRCLRHPVRGKLSLLELALRVGGVSATGSLIAAPGDTERGDRGELAAAFAAVRARLGVVLLLLVLAAVAWWSTIDRMAGMDAGPGTDLGALGWFLGVWVVMMAAMMFPSLAPTTALYARMTRQYGWGRAIVFAAAYLLVWGAAGLVAYGLFRLGRSLFGADLAWHSGGRWFAGGVLAHRRRLRADAAEGCVPGEMPQSARIPARELARRKPRCAGDGSTTCRLVSRLLLGADGRTVRARGHEHHVDGAHRRPDRAREDAAVAPDGHVGHGRAPARARDRGRGLPHTMCPGSSCPAATRPCTR